MVEYRNKTTDISKVDNCVTPNKRRGRRGVEPMLSLRLSNLQFGPQPTLVLRAANDRSQPRLSVSKENCLLIAILVFKLASIFGMKALRLGTGTVMLRSGNGCEDGQSVWL